MRKSTIITAAIFITAVFGLGTVFASSASDDAQALGESNLEIQAAIAIAENHVGGKAYEAELETEGGKTRYEIEVIKNGKEFEVTVDSMTGKVLSSEEEHEGDELERDGDGDGHDKD